MKPEVIYLETTNLCNAKCIMCPHEKITRNPKVMTDEIFYKAVKDCKKLGIKGGQIFLHKEGEPLLDTQIMDRINYVVRELGQDNEIGISTNAMLLDENKAIELIESGVNVVFFSVDGACKEEYEQIRLNLNYDIVKKNIEFFFSKCIEKNVKIRVVMQMLIEDEKYNSSKQFIKNWEKYPCEFYIKRMHGYLDGGRSSQSKNLSVDQTNICNDPFRIAVVYTNGNVGLCCWDYNNEYSLGNIMNEDISKLFNGDKAQNLRKSIIERRCKDIRPCNRCAKIFGNDEISKY